LAKRKKNESKQKSNHVRLREEGRRVEEPTSRPEPDVTQDKRFFYAGGVVVIAVLAGLIWFMIHRSAQESLQYSSPPRAKWLDPTVESGTKGSSASKDSSTLETIPESSTSATGAAANTKAFRDRLKSGGEGPEMVMLGAGSFRMGDIQDSRDKAAQPVRTVRIQRPFAIGRYEVTFEDYDRFAQATGRQLPNDGGGGRGRQPVINFAWGDAVEYAKWLSTQTGKRYRMPSEAEWEYAARGGEETTFWWGNQMKPGMANCVGCGSQWDNKVTAPVGSFQPNPFGLYDTAGNLWEWVEDCDHEDYNGAPTDGSAWKKEGGGNCYTRVFRGGAWNYAARGLRSSFRGRGDPGTRSASIGFRLVREVE
jgi:formylglycine-generating enzyme required for sulfatase activity